MTASAIDAMKSPNPDIVLQGGNAPKNGGDNVSFTLNSLTYQGPPMTIYAWAAIVQNNIVTWESNPATPVPIVIGQDHSAAPGVISFNPPIVLVATPHGGNQSPLAGQKGDGLLIFFATPEVVDPVTSLEIQRFIYIDAIDVVSGGVIESFVPPSGLVVSQVFPDGVLLSWAPATLNGNLYPEWIDVATDENFAQISQAIPDGAAEGVVSGLQPNTSYFARVTSLSPVDGLWYESNHVQFTTGPSGGGTPNINIISAVFS